MSDSPALGSFLDKWHAHWPEWRVAQVFVPVAQRDVAVAWFSLLAELTEAAWGGADPTPGLAKLGWWGEELRGWDKGARRHPLGEVLQRHSAGWALLSAALPSLQASREASHPVDGIEPLATPLQPFARAVAEAEARLFADQAPQAFDIAASLLAEHLLRHADDAARIAMQAQGVLARWPQGRAARPRRIHDALLRARLQGLAGHGSGKPLSSWQALIRAWRAARD